MATRIIQGFFLGGAMRVPAPRDPAQRISRLPPSLVPVGPPPSLRPSREVAQRFGGSGSFEIDPSRIGLARGGGQSLPTALLAKMEAAFGADFSAVRVHIGPQPTRIGAIAFTTGNDLYFAPGQFQPATMTGQRLIGHELAHVVQQRQGRVRSQAAGVAVVQDPVLEAEADRLGMRAANYRLPVQAKMAAGFGSPWGASVPFPAIQRAAAEPTGKAIKAAAAAKRAVAAVAAATASTDLPTKSAAGGDFSGLVKRQEQKGEIKATTDWKLNGLNEFTDKGSRHAEDNLIAALTTQYTNAKNKKQNSIWNDALTVTMNAWPCTHKCDKNLAAVAEKLGIKITVKVTNNKYSKEHKIEGYVGEIVYQ
ncbi:MAG TPA: DUF4157 domain-containing protein [Allosphingosinicella sp.]|jgi:hypothetical protein